MAKETKSAKGLHVPTDWPGAFGVYKYSKPAVMKNISLILIAGLVLIFSSILLDNIFSGGWTNSLIRELLGWVVGAYFGVFVTLVYLSSVRDKSLEFGEAFSNSSKYFVNMLLLTVLELVIAIFSLLFFIVPFFFIVPRLVLSSYFLVDQDMEPIEALKASWDATDGHVGKVWGIIGASIAMGLLVIVLVGVYFLIMYSAAYAVLYFYLTKKKSSKANKAKA